MKRIIHAARVNNQLIFFCLHCRKDHRHSLGDGHRVTHCSKAWSPYADNGYYLKEVSTGLSELKREALYRGFTHEFPQACTTLKGWPVMRIKHNPKTTHLFWTETCMDGEYIGMLSRHYVESGLEETIWKLFEANRKNLNYRSEISTGGAHGAWSYCPNELAGTVINILRDAQETFFSKHLACNGEKT